MPCRTQIRPPRPLPAACRPPPAAPLLPTWRAPTQIAVSSFEEDLPKHQYTPAEYARLTAVHKAVDVAAALAGPRPADLVVGADTVVELRGEVLEKPADAADAHRMLALLSGQRHEVHTGVALVLPPREAGGDPRVHSFAVTTAVEFAELTDAAIAAYIQTGEPFGKAGAYGIQGAAAAFVRRVDGCFYSVVGFPLHAFCIEVAGLIERRELIL